MSDDGPFLVAIALAVLCALGGCSMGDSDGYKRAQVEAVEGGHAHWVVDAKGTTTFEWNNKGACK